VIPLRHVICSMLWTLAALAPNEAVAVDDRKCTTPIATVDSKYTPGQVWKFKNRLGESASRVTILRVETLPKLGLIIHIRIDGVQFKNCTGGPAPTSIAHAPFSKEAMDDSVTQLIRSGIQVPEYMAGYREWLAHCGGAYTISLAEMVNADETTFNAGLGCPAQK